MKLYTLSREQTVDITYRIRAESLEQAVQRLRDYDEQHICSQQEDDYVELGVISCRDEHGHWHEVEDACLCFRCQAGEPLVPEVEEEVAECR